MSKTLGMIEEVGEFFERTGRRFAIIYESTLPEAKHGEMRVAFSSSSDADFIESSLDCFNASASIALNQIRDKGNLDKGFFNQGPIDEWDPDNSDNSDNSD